MSFGTALVVLDGAIATVALPTIARDLDVGSSAAVLVVTVYQLVLVMTLLPFSNLGDRIGQKRLYQSGQIVFTIATILCFFARSLPFLLVVRAVQALGAAATGEREAIDAFHTLRSLLESGEIRAAEPDASSALGWQVNAWVKRGILLGFRLGATVEMGAGAYVDKHTYPARVFTAAAALGGSRPMSSEEVERIENRLDEHYRQRALKL